MYDNDYQNQIQFRIPPVSAVFQYQMSEKFKAHSKGIWSLYAKLSKIVNDFSRCGLITKKIID